MALYHCDLGLRDGTLHEDREGWAGDTCTHDQDVERHCGWSVEASKGDIVLLLVGTNSGSKSSREMIVQSALHAEERETVKGELRKIYWAMSPFDPRSPC